MNNVIFACVHSAGRSQMAAAFFNAYAEPRQAQALSAGTRPAERVHPEVVAVMREAGLDLSAARPRLLTPDVAAGAVLLVTMGCGEACPVIAGVEQLDWPQRDPRGLELAEVRVIRDEIRTRVAELVASRGWQISALFEARSPERAHPAPPRTRER